MTLIAATDAGGFDTGVLVFGLLVMGGALVSGLARRSFLSLTALFVLVGFALGEGGLDVLDLRAESGFVSGLAIVALIVLLFRDGLESRRRCSSLFGDGWAAIAIVAVTLLVARPVAIWVALAGTGLSTAVKAFMDWFGPKGVATMTFSLLVLAADFEGDERIFNLAALCVFASILLHGLTDTPGVDWIARREGRPAPER